MKIKITYGLSNSLTREFPEGTTVGDVIHNKSIMSALGFGDNVVGKIEGMTQPSERRLVDGDELDVEVKANTKAKLRKACSRRRT